MKKYGISKLKAREVLDSRGNPTIEVDVHTGGGVVGTAMIPSGASTGVYEALELRDGGSRFHGKGVLRACASVTEIIAPKLLGGDVREQERIDSLMIELDGTSNKSRLGGNAILGVSLACSKAAAEAEGLQLHEHVGGRSLLPIPFFNVINGGQHAGNDLDFQEFMIAPIGAKTFREALTMGSEVYHELKAQLTSTYGRSAINVGDEGGFAPPIKRPEKALETIEGAVEEMGYGGSVSLAMDVAASSFHGPDGYCVEEVNLTREDLIERYGEMISVYPIISIEDPLEEEDYEGFALATRELGIQILGDDLFVTNSSRLRRGIEIGAANALLWKVNQVGTLTEAIEAAETARGSGYAVMASHRSGETEDTFVADLVVGLGFGQIKSGAPARGERTAKYNRLLRIEERLGERARYPSGLK